ncbi:hypothetical protein [Ideonella sp.]|uniref:hypothetical protein n=1 Tax=Ideonella sp. TaxID=1929293 RepID=UPI002B48E0F1|nr:hypothetical protein [Ideonella sp.]HJV72234.1 hypothetical protein [Ideonella sp.]
MDSRPIPPDTPAATPPRFDVFIRLPRGMSPEEAQRRVVEQGGLTPAQGESIAAALRQVPMVQVRRAVDEARARKTEHQLSLAGLRVEVKRLPTATPAEHSPAAHGHAALVADNPEDFEFDLHAAANDDDATVFSPLTTRPATRPGGPSTLPAGMSAPRQDAPAARRRPHLIGVAALVGVAGVAFVLGRMSMPWTPAADNPAGATQSIDKVLTTVGAPPALAEASSPGASAAGFAPADELRDADSLTQLAQAERAQGRATTLEQAVAQAQGSQAAAGLLLPGDRLPASIAQAAASPTSAGPAATPQGASGGTVPLLPAAQRATLTADLAVQLAEFGQTARAREVLARLRSDAVLNGDPAVSASAERAEVLLLAWSLREANGASIDRGIASLRNLVHGIDSPAARAALMGRVATVLARHDNVPDALALACLADAGEALKGVADGAQRQAAIDDWLVDTGDLLLSQLARHARLGRWPQAQSLAGQLDTLAGQARSAHAVLQLQALRARAQDLMGHPAKSEKLLADALKSWSQHGSPVRQADELRALASRAGDIASPELFQVTAQLATAADALHGTERARALISLALMQAEAGEAERFEALKSMLRQSSESLRPEQAALTAQLLVGGELAAARAEQRAGAFGLAEARMRKVAAYLL